MEMNDSALTVDQLDALSRAVPDDQERKDVRLYLQVSAVTLNSKCLPCLQACSASSGAELHELLTCTAYIRYL